MKIKYQGIYAIFDSDGSCWYVGQSTDIYLRWTGHKKYIHDEWHNKMQARLDDFTFKILELVDDVDDLRNREDHYIDLLKPKYTSKESNKGSFVGHHTDEAKAKMSANHADFSGENHPMFGKHCSDESKNKNSASHIGQIPWNKDKTSVYSEETLKK